VTLFKQFFLPRFVQWLVVIFIGVTLTFLIPRLSPINPVDQAMARLSAFANREPEATLALRESLEDLYGLKGSILEQYLSFWKRVVRVDLGPSFFAFPETVNSMIGRSVFWTVGLLGTTTILSWLLGLLLGSLAGYFPNRWWSRLMDASVITVYPIPYYILAFVMLMLFAYYWPIFPLVGGGQGLPRLTLEYIGSVLFHSFLPAVSIIIGAGAFRFIVSRALSSTERSSDHVQYAELAALPKRKILFNYIIRNTMLPQVTDLGLSLGSIFEGALIAEVVFGYPGLGQTVYNAVLSSDYNLIMGITLMSIIGIATASLLIDISYPLFDPRVRFR
jgi:peptide/nickel transport system permease protein